jgi:uncharacterized membrane protein
MISLLILLLVVWVVVAILGFTLHGLWWLAVIAIVLFVATGAVGWIRRSSIRR